MKRLFTIMTCLLAMMAASLSVKAQEITITLLPGWTWISYPMADAMDIPTVLGDFAPMEGDMIKSQFGIVEYQNGQWAGDLQQFTPGLGYMYYSMRGEPVALVFGGSVPQPQVTVETATPTDITPVSAVVGGTVTVPEGGHVFLRGVCWGTEPNPDIDGDHTTNGTGIGVFSDNLVDLTPDTTYYVRAYAVTDYGLAYGENLSFVADYGYVDLGLPSGLLWATCNVGAETPEDYGDYFAWGETQPKYYYDWITYQYCNGSENTLIKYCNNPDYGYHGFTDNLTTLLPEDDAATSNWGTDWRMPTKEEWQELYNNTTCTWTTQNGVSGRLFTASNGNSLFLPAAGSRYYSNLLGAGSHGSYRSSSLDTSFTSHAWILHTDSDLYDMWISYRSFGHSVRAVRCKNRVINVTTNLTEGGTVSGGGTYMDQTVCTVTASTNEGYNFVNWTENGEVVSTEATYSFIVTGNRNLVANFSNRTYVDLGLPSGLLWATCNVGADSPEDYGDYFAWGETQPKDIYNWNTYQYCNGSNNTLTKYCNNSNFGYNGFTDNLTTLLPEDDAATANWGSGWRMPTKEEWQELYNNTTITWTTQNGVNGRLFTASNGNSLFLPAAGYHGNSSLFYAGSGCRYWSSFLHTDYPLSAWILYFSSDGYSMNRSHRRCGQPVRAVCSSRQN